jgi:hypothetical protein
MLTYEKKVEKLCIEYEGPFMIQVISTFAKYLLENIAITESANKKLHKVFIELAQNVALYSLDRVHLASGATIGKGKIYITENSDNYKCITINRIQQEHAGLLVHNCNEINHTPYETLRNKKKYLCKTANSKESGAHIGLIMIYMYSGNKINFRIIKKAENEVYFKITATINKNK